ncbi:hypothetical protein [Microscilla marina]|nr:hypothetical protein [Microscilla marina]
MHFTIWTEKRPGKGEDAVPTLLVNDDYTQGVLVVYDGLGGAGSKLYTYQDNQGKTVAHTGAYLASRLAKQITEHFFATISTGEEVEKDFIAGLKTDLLKGFADKVDQIDQNPSKLRSKLIKRLPTTLAGLYYTSDTHQQLKVTSFWAGDSRCYALTANGLCQLSNDDLNGTPDALENLLMDATISNCIHADGKYSINQSTVLVKEPVILITATDGCFGFVKSPAHFEYLLLQALMNSQYDAEAWKECLEEAMGAIAGDDLSMSVLALGRKTLEDWKVYFYERFKYVQARFVRPVEEAEASMQFLQKQEGFLPVETEKLYKQKRLLLEQLWQAYKENYYG